MDIAGVDVEIDVIKEYPELEDLVVNPSTEKQNFNSNKYGFKSVTINEIKGEELDLNPSAEEQVVTGVFSKVKVKPIESKKLSATPTMEEQVITGMFDTVVVNPIETEELYAIPSTEEQVKTGLFNTVVVSPIQGETLNLAPSEEQQSAEGVFTQVNINPIQVEEITTDLDFSTSDEMELTAKEGVYIKKAIINKDANLTPENIKSGVSVCGIAGDVADTSDADATSDDIAVGKTAYVNNQKIVGAMKANFGVITSLTEPGGKDRQPIWVKASKNIFNPFLAVMPNPINGISIQRDSNGVFHIKGKTTSSGAFWKYGITLPQSLVGKYITLWVEGSSELFDPGTQIYPGIRNSAGDVLVLNADPANQMVKSMLVTQELVDNYLSFGLFVMGGYQHTDTQMKVMLAVGNHKTSQPPYRDMSYEPYIEPEVYIQNKNDIYLKPNDFINNRHDYI